MYIVYLLLPVVKAFPVGFEPTTCRLEGGCSIQLSYGDKWDWRESNPHDF